MKKVLAFLVVAVVLVLAIMPVMAASKEEIAKQLADLYAKQIDLQKQMVQLQVQAGYLTKEQGDWIIAQLDLKKKYITENPGVLLERGYGWGGCRFGPRLRGYGRWFGWPAGPGVFKAPAPAPNL